MYVYQKLDKGFKNIIIFFIIFFFYYFYYSNFFFLNIFFTIFVIVNFFYYFYYSKFFFDYIVNFFVFFFIIIVYNLTLLYENGQFENIRKIGRGGFSKIYNSFLKQLNNSENITLKELV